MAFPSWVRGALFAVDIFCLTTTPAPAATRLNATEAATRIGQDVIFEDVVKAISRSRTKPGCYLSFGAPFPKQVLSVWIPDEVWEKISHAPGLLGRSVHVRGRVAATSTGPMIRLTAPEELALLAVDDSILAKDFLDGRMDREHFMAAVALTFWREDYATLEELVRELQESHERFSDGTWIEESFFRGLELTDTATDERYEQAGARFNRWLAHYHSSAAAAIAQAGYQINLSWHLRATRPPDRILETQEQIKRALALARQLLEGKPAAKAVPAWFIKMQMVALAQGWTHEQYFRLFEEAIARQPDYEAFYFHAANYLRVKEGRGAWERFAEEQRQQHGPGGAGDPLYTRIAWSMSVNYHNLFESTQASWETMAAGFSRLIAEHPDSRWLKNAYARFAFLARDRERLRPALAAVGDDPDMGIWVNLENVGFAKKFAGPSSDAAR
ncbi:MAG: hypothetical protein ACR2MW_00580 [Chthoniobacterales bacterium]